MNKSLLFRIVNLIILCLTLGGLTYFWMGYDRSHSLESRPTLLGQSAPELELGSGSKLSKWRGQPILLHFWATWCGPCLVELPNLVEQTKNWRAKGGQVLLIAVDQDWKNVDGFLMRDPRLRNIKSEIPLFLDPDSRMADRYQSNQFPETFLINQDFVVDNKWVGAQDWKNIPLPTFQGRIKK